MNRYLSHTPYGCAELQEYILAMHSHISAYCFIIRYWLRALTSIILGLIKFFSSLIFFNLTIVILFIVGHGN